MSTLRVSLINDPRNEYDALFTVQRLGNVVGGLSVRYLNVPIAFMKKMCVDSIEKRDEPVWFGCDYGKFNDRKTACLTRKFLISVFYTILAHQ